MVAYLNENRAQARQCRRVVYALIKEAVPRASDNAPDMFLITMLNLANPFDEEYKDTKASRMLPAPTL